VNWKQIMVILRLNSWPRQNESVVFRFCHDAMAKMSSAHRDASAAAPVASAENRPVAAAVMAAAKRDPAAVAPWPETDPCATTTSR